MPRFLIESPHSQQECLKALQQVLAAGYLPRFYWGCKSGEHTGCGILGGPEIVTNLHAVTDLRYI